MPSLVHRLGLRCTDIGYWVTGTYAVNVPDTTSEWELFLGDKVGVYLKIYVGTLLSFDPQSMESGGWDMRLTDGRRGEKSQDTIQSLASLHFSRSW